MPSGALGSGARRPEQGWNCRGCRRTAGVADVEPGPSAIRGREDVAGIRTDDDVAAIDRIDREVSDPVDRPLRVGSWQALDCWSRPKVVPMLLTWKKLVSSKPPVSRRRLNLGASTDTTVPRALLIDTHTAAVQVLAHVEGRRCVEHTPLDIAIRQDIGVRERSAVVLSSHHRTRHRRSERPHCSAGPHHNRTG